jgi:hypothetical protein
MDIFESTRDYETWLAARLTLIPDDIQLKHQHMAEAAFPFLRATFYRWAQTWPDACPEAAAAPVVMAVGDLHIENFGTWRDSEGRLIWGLNDFDEACPMPYTIDLVRLATSAFLAIDADHLSLDPDDACKALLKGYGEALRDGGGPFVLAENYRVLREWAVARLKDPGEFWERFDGATELKDVPQEVSDVLRKYLPDPNMPYRVYHRIAGLGSLGRQRFVAVGQWHGGSIAREAKALVPSAWLWQQDHASDELHYEQVLTTSVRMVDPWVHLAGRWIVRRLSPDCRRIELDSLPEDRNELKLLTLMGRETANIHLCNGATVCKTIGEDLDKRPKKWLLKAAQAMVDSVNADWKQWRKTARQASGERAGSARVALVAN